MFTVVAQCGCLYGIVDDADNVVEWANKEDIMGYLAQGTAISGVTPEGEFSVNPIYYVNYNKLVYEGMSMFDNCTDITYGSGNKAEYKFEGKKYKIRAIKHIEKGMTAELKGYSFLADESGWFVKLSNGLCTILPDEKFDSLFGGIIDTKKCDA